MSKKLKKSLSWLLTFCMLISLFCGMVPTASAADFNASIYDTDGISISLERSYAATNGKTVNFTVIVDNETVVDAKQVTGVPADNVDLIIDAEGYTVAFPTTDGCSITAKGSRWLLDLHQYTENSFNVTINLASEKKSDAIEIADDSTSYGTFHWQKNNAGNTAYSRTLTVYVNGEQAYQQTINTPQILLGDQYWFVPNGTKYTLDRIDPSSSLDFGAMKDIDVYLITKCACGLATCTCEGGCNCPKNCDCAACTGATLTDNQINTGYGIITYKDPGVFGGYRFTVEVYVNGQQEFVSKELRIPGSTHAAVKFEPASGYFYHEPNGYDLDTAMTTSSWSYVTGMVTFGGALSTDREYDNVLKIYLWTFEKDALLDVERQVGTSAEQVTGYLITFDAYDPKTDSTKTYTYEATSFLAAQAQHIPMGTEVTLTAICPSGKEVTKWSTAEAYTNADFKGIKGEDGTEAYGNTVYLTVNQNTEVRVLVYIEGIDNVQAPTDECLKKLLDDQITVTCTNEDADHDPISYKLDLNSVTRPPAGVTGDALNHYAYTIKISSDSYVDQYDIATGKTHTPASATEEVTLEYNGKDWTVKDGDSLVNFNVKCETTTPPDPTTKDITLNFFDEVNYVQVKEESMTVKIDATSVDVADIKIPDGYELVDPSVTSLAINDGYVYVGVKPVATTGTMNIRFVEESTGKLIASGNYTLPLGVQNYNILNKYVPDGYQMCVAGDFMVTDGGKLDVPVKKTASDSKYIVRFFIANENGGSYRVNGRYVKAVNLVAEYDEDLGTYVVQFPTLKVNKDYELTGWKVSGRYTAIWHEDSSEVRGVEGLVNANNYLTITPIFAYTGDNDDNDHPTVETRYTIEATAHKGGEISPDGIYKVYKYSDKTYTITADKGYKIYDVVVDGVSVGAVHTYTFERVTEDHTIEVYFAKLPTDPDDSGTSNWLETKDHVAYMTGYPDGTFGPNRNMTRAEVAQMFYALLLNKNVTTTVAFSDVSADAWYAKAVNTLASLGMVSGYPDGTFHPDAPITRAEFATIALAFAYEPLTASCNYNDVPTSAWFYTYVAQATTYGWIGGSNGYFRPNDNITRAEVSVIVNNMLGRAADEDYVDAHAGDLVTFPDVRSSFWAYYSIMETVNDHEYVKLNGLEDWK